MAEPENNERGESEQGGASTEKYYTLSEVSQKTGISMPTLQRYKKLYQNRIPSQGKGRKQRYPESAMPVFDELRNENAGRRGRPRKDASGAGGSGNNGNGAKATASRGRGRVAAKATKATKSAAKPAKATKAAASGRGAAGRKAVGSKRGGAAAAAPAARGRAATGRKVGRPPGRPAAAARNAAGTAAGRNAGRGGARRGGSSNLMTLTQISEQTGISYPTLVRYVRMHADRLPSEGTGRARRFYPQAVDVFRQLRQESGRGGRKKGSGAGAARGGVSSGGRGANDSGMNQRMRALEKQQQDLAKKFRGFVQSLSKLFR